MHNQKQLNQESRSQKKSLVTKILLFIGIPLAIILCLVGVITMTTVKHSVSDVTNNELIARTQAAANEINASFSVSIDATINMAANTQFESMCKMTGQGENMMMKSGYPEFLQTMKNVAEKDTENIMCAWIGDEDSDTCTDSDGWINEPGYDVSTRDWWLAAKEAQGPTLTAPYVDETTGLVVVSALTPIYDSANDNMIGVAGLDFNIDSIYAMIKEYKLGDTGFYMLFDLNGNVIYHPDEEYKNVNIADTEMSKNIKDAVENKKVGEVTYTNNGEKCHGFLAEIGNTGWMVATGLPDKEFNSAYHSVQVTILLLFLFALLIVLFLLVIISRKIVAPLKKLATAADKMALGDIDVDVSNLPDSQDEIGELTNSFHKMVENTKAQSQVAEKIAAGNISVAI